ncbi:sodium:solute symporter [Fodinibius salsisoli]|uniref:Sodium:solute symporter n=1 Tax=Fodinibius salsisoli TaxID=2820877 RepID=A0ABT3PHA0_9BACT|nr:sodium:solute symporter [Fodinibius salsisoli]MCW9705287.1 sodium:solute symporter [Fodinibius salsisoli]
MLELPVVDYVILIVYLLGIVILGSWFVRKNRTPDAFMAANRSLSGWVVGLSIVGTYISSISFLANPGKSYMANWNPLVFSFALPIAGWIAIRYFVPFYRKVGEVSAYHHLENRFGPWARTYAVVMYLLTQMARVGTILYLVALTMTTFLGVSIQTIIIITGVLVIIYTLLGGIEAVIWTDAVQTVVLVFGAIITIVVLLVNMPGGISQLFTVAMESNKFSLGSFGSSLSEPTFWVVLVYGMAINLQNFGIDQGYIQRYITARSDKDAQMSVWIGALSYIPISATFFFIGTALFVFYSAQPELLPAGIEGDSVFPYFIVSELPVGITGIIIAAIFAAAMSTVDSSLNSSATLILEDIYKRYVRPNASDKEAMRVLYTATLVWGIIGTGMALLMIGAQSALDIWWEYASIFSGGMLGLFLLGLISRARNPAAITGVCCGMLVILWMSVSKSWTGNLAAFSSPFHTFLVIVIGTLVILLVGIFVSRMRRSFSKK